MARTVIPTADLKKKKRRLTLIGWKNKTLAGTILIKKTKTKRAKVKERNHN